MAQCEVCGNIFTIPKPTEQELSDIYTNNYMYSVHFAILPEKRARAREMARMVVKERDDKTGNKVLEIGSMYGYLLEELKKKEFDICGVELDKKAVEHCKENGIETFQMSVEQFVKESKKKFDVIIMSHVLEHVLEPKEVLLQLNEILNDNGQLIIAVPNSSSINRKVFGRYWGWWQVPVHVDHFNLGGLSKLLQVTNFKISKHKFYGGDSMMILLNFINMVGLKGKQKELGTFQTLIIKCFSFIFRWWYWIGNEELVIIAKKNS